MKTSKPELPIFYVYEHWRPDTNECFWVGKGNGDRGYRFKRNNYYNNVVAKLSKMGMCVEVRLVKSGLNEREALSLEKEQIALWRLAGVTLTNFTDGGEGTSGLKHSDKTKETLRFKRAAQTIIINEETKRKIGDAQRGKPRKKHTPETIAKIRSYRHSDATKRKMSQDRMGHKVSDETRAKQRASNLGKKYSLEARENMRRAQLGTVQTLEHRLAIGNALRGRKRGPMSEETKIKISITKRQRSKIKAT